MAQAKSVGAEVERAKSTLESEAPAPSADGRLADVAAKLPFKGLP
jgi:hypothetical protein